MDFTGQDIIDVRDLIARFEELEIELETRIRPHGDDLEAEHKALHELLESLKGCGGDEQWRGSWYPGTLIAESRFVDYCQELVEDIGDVPKGLPDYIVVDWEATARNIRIDYSEVDFGGYTYLYR